mgnify:CR=1 FL=1
MYAKIKEYWLVKNCNVGDSDAGFFSFDLLILQNYK